MIEGELTEQEMFDQDWCPWTVVFKFSSTYIGNVY